MFRFRRVLVAVFLAGQGLLAGGANAAPWPTSHTLEVKGVKLHYVVAGKGEPVVLIHGWHSSADINWRLTGVFRDLARDHQVIALDLPGHGRSDKPEGDDAYGLQMVEDVVLLLDHLKVQKAHVVGYSLGGMVTAKLLAAHPERVSSALIGGMGWFREGSGLQRIWGGMAAHSQGADAAFVRNVPRLALTAAELSKIALPVEVVVGAEDPVKDLYVVPLRPVRKDWPVVEIADAGHFNCIVKPEFRMAIVDWVRKNTQGAK